MILDDGSARSTIMLLLIKPQQVDVLLLGITVHKTRFRQDVDNSLIKALITIRYRTLHWQGRSQLY